MSEPYPLFSCFCSRVLYAPTISWKSVNDDGVCIYKCVIQRLYPVLLHVPACVLHMEHGGEWILDIGGRESCLYGAAGRPPPSRARAAFSEA